MSAMQAKQARAADLLHSVTAFNPNELAAAFASARQAEVSGGHVRLIVSGLCLLGLVLLSWWIGGGVIRSLARLRSACVGSAVATSTGRSRSRAATTSWPSWRGRPTRWPRVSSASGGSAIRTTGCATRWWGWARRCAASSSRPNWPPARFGSWPVTWRPLRARSTTWMVIGSCACSDSMGTRPEDGCRAAASAWAKGWSDRRRSARRSPSSTIRPRTTCALRSGLGEGAPRAIVLVPLRQIGRPRGVLELALFAPWSSARPPTLDAGAGEPGDRAGGRAGAGGDPPAAGGDATPGRSACCSRRRSCGRPTRSWRPSRRSFARPTRS